VAKTVRAFLRAEELLDPAADLVDRAVPFGEPAINFGPAPGPKMGDGDARRAATCLYGTFEYLAPISAVGIDVAWVVRKHGLIAAAVIGVAQA
jgi:hypothetical protein